MGDIRRLSLAIDASPPNYPTVRLMVDDTELLNPDGQEKGNDPADLLDTTALLPQDEPLRIAFYGCGCGCFGCTCVSGLITESAGSIHWADFRTVTGVYHAALPSTEYEPAALAHAGTPLDLPDLTFDAEQYRAAVGEAMADRGWETRPRAIVRLMRLQRPDWHHWAARRGDLITVHHPAGSMIPSTHLQVPEGPVGRLADRLVELLEHYDPREIDEGRLWG